MYVIHHAGVIKYVGNTNGPTISSGERLRRQFQQGASSGKHNYPKLAWLPSPPDIMVSVFSSQTIDELTERLGKG